MLDSFRVQASVVTAEFPCGKRSDCAFTWAELILIVRRGWMLRATGAFDVRIARQTRPRHASAHQRAPLGNCVHLGSDGREDARDRERARCRRLAECDGRWLRLMGERV